jgi:hypothetical protein
MRTTLETEYGLKEKKKVDDQPLESGDVEEGGSGASIVNAE